MVLKALGLDEAFRSVLMEMISIQKLKFWGSPTFKNQAEETFIRESTHHVPGTKLSGGDTKERH